MIPIVHHQPLEARIWKSTKAFSCSCGLTIFIGCGGPLVGVTVVDERTTLENQVLGTYQELNQQVMLVASVRYIDPQGKLNQTQELPPGKKDVVRALQRVSFNKDDLNHYKSLGMIGENNEGGITLLSPEKVDNAKRAFVDNPIKEENEDRLAIMSRIVDTNETLSAKDLPRVHKMFAPSTEIRRSGRTHSTRKRELDFKRNTKVRCNTNLCLSRHNPMTEHRYVIILNLCLFLLGSTQAMGSTPDPVTTHPALAYQPSVSADGQTMAFTSMRSGNADIWVQTLKSSALTLPRQMTTHPANNQEPALNKAGTRLLYVSHKSAPRGDVYLLDLITCEEQQLTDLTSGDTSPQWDQEEEGFFYLKRDSRQSTSAIYRKSFSDPVDELVVPQVTSFPSNRDGQLLFSNDTRLTLMNLQGNRPIPLKQQEHGLNLWLALDRHASEATTNSPVFFSANMHEILTAMDLSILMMNHR